jgi:hypothetical protein
MAEQRPWWLLVTATATHALRSIKEAAQPIRRWLRARIAPPENPRDGSRNQPGDDLH